MTLADRPDAAPVRSREEVFSGRVWNVVRDVVDLPGGSTVVREIVAHPGAVAVAALDERGRLLVIQQYRHPIGTYEWELPAGLLDVPGEDPLEAARRELFEEGDLTAAHWEHLLRYATSPGGSDEHIDVYVARGLTVVPEGERYVRTDEEAGMPTRWMGLDEVVTAITDGHLHNGTLLLTALRLAVSGGS